MMRRRNGSHRGIEKRNRKKEKTEREEDSGKRDVHPPRKGGQSQEQN